MIWRPRRRRRDANDKAIATLQEALRLRPGVPAFHDRLGSALRAAGRQQPAIAEFRAAIRLHPDFAEAYLNLGMALSDLGDVRGAIAAYRDAIRAAPTLAAAHYDLGINLKRSGDARGAVAAYREAIHCKPDFPQAHTNLGNLLKELGDLPGAIAAHREAIRLDPKRAAHELGLQLARRSAILPARSRSSAKPFGWRLAILTPTTTSDSPWRTLGIGRRQLLSFSRPPSCGRTSRLGNTTWGELYAPRVTPGARSRRCVKRFV